MLDESILYIAVHDRQLRKILVPNKRTAVEGKQWVAAAEPMCRDEIGKSRARRTGYRSGRGGCVRPVDAYAGPLGRLDDES